MPSNYSLLTQRETHNQVEVKWPAQRSVERLTS